MSEETTTQPVPEQVLYTMQQMPAAELEAMTAEITVILEKYNAEIGVSSTLQFLKRVPQTTNESANNETTEAPSEEGGFEVPDKVA